MFGYRLVLAVRRVSRFTRGHLDNVCAEFAAPFHFLVNWKGGDVTDLWKGGCESLVVKRIDRWRCM